ncbi:hypothetical protein NT6N_01570 [Oceaniferula spumae]|uniref:Type II secretion system protein GspG C-terminal domain-containing protein n=1 Tax=Oceaniferula spumae TaxID=2979115 RepID=A0AAT9FGS6_9BACT
MKRFPIFAFIAFLSLSVWLLTVAIDRQDPVDIPGKLDDDFRRTTDLTDRPAPPKPKSFPENITLLPVAESSDLLNSPNQTPEEDLSLIQSMLGFHRRALGGNPVGLNDEITAALTGKNVKGAVSLPPTHPAISDKGELLDRWGTPYRFHAYSAKVMEIHSAGPDKKFFTSDDLKLLE